MKLIMQFSPGSYYFLPFRSKYSSHALLSNILNLCSSLSMTNKVSHALKHPQSMFFIQHDIKFHIYTKQKIKL